ncbi:MAG: M48 family metallopeptidase [Bacteroidales bacterium]|jgi:predicted metal-dependent hydrolase|nr:M48 family metallopeptidase [Bacteroidales bacterium]
MGRLEGSQIIHFEQIGDVTFVAGATARNIRISVKPFDGVRVTVPRREALQTAMDFVKRKADWIRKAQSKIAQQEGAYTVFTPETQFATATRRLRLFPCNTLNFRVQTTKEELQIFYPESADLLSAPVQETIRTVIIERLRREAKERLPERTAQLAEQHGFRYKGVSVKNMSSRWGSCSACNHINLNVHLMRLPEHLQDYVVLHELVHTVHKNHAQGFWDCLNQHTDGKAKQLAGGVKLYHASLF